jgi:Restriction endonuclease
LSTLDFSKLVGPPSGEAFEGLVRLMGAPLGMIVEWSGRGADRGRDLILIETQQGPIKARTFRWLVSCKDNSKSNRAVTETDVGSVLDKVRQHKCDGFLLATTTTASTGLKEMLDRLDSAAEGPIQTKVWDRFEITQMLLSDRFSHLLMQFFPEHHRREAVAKLDAARQVVEAALPRFIAGRVRESLIPYKERYDLLSGSKMWPHNAIQKNVITTLQLTVVQNLNAHVTREAINKLDFDPFMAFSDRLIRNFPGRAIEFLKLVAEISTDDRVIYNAIEMLKESGDFSVKDELEITRRRDSDTLYDLYFDKVHDILEDLESWAGELLKPHGVDVVHVVDVDIEREAFSGGSKVSVSTGVIAYVRDDLDDPGSTRSVPLNFEGHLEGSGPDLRLVIESIH